MSNPLGSEKVKQLYELKREGRSMRSIARDLGSRGNRLASRIKRTLGINLE